MFPVPKGKAAKRPLTLFSIAPNQQRFSTQMTGFLFLPPSLVSACPHLSPVPHFSGRHIPGFPRHLISGLVGSFFFFSLQQKKKKKVKVNKFVLQIKKLLCPETEV